MVYTPKNRDIPVKKEPNSTSKNNERGRADVGRADGGRDKSDKIQKGKEDGKSNAGLDEDATKSGNAMDTAQGPTNKEDRKFTGRCRLFVGNLTPDTTDEQFKKMFETYGEISEVYLNAARGFGFIRLDYRHNAEAAKAALDGMQMKGRVLRVRFATHGAALKVTNLSPYISNELLEKAFAQFGDVERAIVIVDDRGKSTGEGIVEFVRKPGAQQALRRVTEGVFLLGSSPRPISVEPLEQKDEDDGLSEKFINKSDQYKKEREKEPRFAVPGSFEYEFGLRWKQIDEMEKDRHKRVDKEMEEARLKLEDEMQNALYDYQAEQIRQDLIRQQEELRRIEEMRAQEQMRRRQEMELRRQEEERLRNEEERRRQEMLMRQQELASRRGIVDRGVPLGDRSREEMLARRNAAARDQVGMGMNMMGGSGGMAGGSYGGQSGMSMSGGSGAASSASLRGGSMNSGGSMSALGNAAMQSDFIPRPSRGFDQGAASNYESGFGNQGGMNSGQSPLSSSGIGGGPGNMFVGGGMSSQALPGGDRSAALMDRRREAAVREDFIDSKRMRRY